MRNMQIIHRKMPMKRRNSEWKKLSSRNKMRVGRNEPEISWSCLNTHAPINLSLIARFIFHYVFVAIKTHNKLFFHIYIYTECPRRNMRDFGRVFLMLNYTDITQNTYIQS